jgi:hypothetical protein
LVRDPPGQLGSPWLELFQSCKGCLGSEVPKVYRILLVRGPPGLQIFSNFRCKNTYSFNYISKYIYIDIDRYIDIDI